MQNKAFRFKGALLLCLLAAIVLNPSLAKASNSENEESIQICERHVAVLDFFPAETVFTPLGPGHIIVDTNHAIPLTLQTLQDVRASLYEEVHDELVGIANERVAHLQGDEPTSGTSHLARHEDWSGERFAGWDHVPLNWIPEGMRNLIELYFHKKKKNNVLWNRVLSTLEYFSHRNYSEQAFDAVARRQRDNDRFDNFVLTQTSAWEAYGKDIYPSPEGYYVLKEGDASPLMEGLRSSELRFLEQDRSPQALDFARRIRSDLKAIPLGGPKGFGDREIVVEALSAKYAHPEIKAKILTADKDFPYGLFRWVLGKQLAMQLWDNGIVKGKDVSEHPALSPHTRAEDAIFDDVPRIRQGSPLLHVSGENGSVVVSKIQSPRHIPYIVMGFDIKKYKKHLLIYFVLPPEGKIHNFTYDLSDH